MGPDISNVCIPDGVRRCRVKLFIRDVVKLAAEIGVSCSGSPWPDPLGRSFGWTCHKSVGSSV